MKMKKKFLSLALAFTMLASVIPAQATGSPNLDELRQNVANAQQAYDNAVAQYNDGMYGFFEWQIQNGINTASATAALDALNNGKDASCFPKHNEGKYTSYNHRGDEYDATAFNNVLPMEALLNECNELRATDDTNTGMNPDPDGNMPERLPYKTNNYMMAVAEANANVSSFTYDHCGQFAVSECLAWGREDPYDGWYHAEKASSDFLKQGHYRLIMSNQRDVTGLARSYAEFLNCDSQTLGHSEDYSFEASETMTITEYFDLLRRYINEIDVDGKKATLDDAKNALARADGTYCKTNGHSYNNGVVTKKATCTETGTKTYTCSVCGNTKTESIKAIGHKYDNGVITKPATCTENGVKTYTCATCKATKTETISATGHKYNNGVVTKKATCTEAGVKTYTCTVCGNTKTESIAKTAHKYDNGVVTVKPTCVNNGTKTYTCGVCKATKTESIDALGHDFVNYYYNDEESKNLPYDVKTAVCEREGCNETNTYECEALPFTDVKKPDYFYNAVRWAIDHNITAGTSKTTFSPDTTCTRAQVVTFLYRAAGEPELKSDKNPFVDIKPSDYFYNAVLWAVENNITAGTGKTTFSPNSVCTRNQVVTFLYRASGSPTVENHNTPFVDIKTSEYYYNAVLWAVENGITSGTDKTHFAPNEKCTRAQVVTFLYRNSCSPENGRPE